MELQEVALSEGNGAPVVEKNMAYLQDIEVELHVRVGKARLTVMSYLHCQKTKSFRCWSR